MDPGSPSGVRVHYQALAEGLRRRGHTVTIATPADASPAVRAVAALMRRCGRLRGRARYLVVLQHSYAVRLRDACRRNDGMDLVHAQDILAGAVARQVLGRSMPILVSCHFNGSPAGEVARQAGWSETMAGRLRAAYVRWMDGLRHFVATSEFVAARLRELKTDPGDVRVIYNGVDFARHDAAVPDGALRRRFPGRAIVVNAGTLERRKNQALILDVADRMRDVPVVFCLVGDGPDRGALEGAVHARDLGGNVALLGRREDWASVLKATDAYLHTALLENCPLAVLDAMGLGVPVLARAGGGTEELFRTTRARACLDESASADSLAAALRALLSDPGALRALGREQQQCVRSEFAIERMLDRTEAFYRDIVEAHA